MSGSRRVPVPPQPCLNCGVVSEYCWVHESEPDFEVGDLICCGRCDAIHEIVADGLQLTGEFDRSGAVIGTDDGDDDGGESTKF